MISKQLLATIKKNIKIKKQSGTYKKERIILNAQGSEIRIKNQTKKDNNSVELLNFCSNNYLGLANNLRIKKAIIKSLKDYGYGMASVRFICGTQDIHKELEKNISKYLMKEDTILYTSCFDANGGLFENLLTEKDTIISASLNHASIIDGVRLCKAQRKVYRYDNIKDLEKQLKSCRKTGIKAVVTDGVFSMEGEIAPVDKISKLCKKHNALLIVDDSHAFGFIGKGGRGSSEYYNVLNKVDLITGTFGKALGGASGGFISGKKEIIDWFRNSSRPYLFSNSLAPPLVAGAIESLRIVMSKEGDKLRKKLANNTMYFRNIMKQNGFKINDSIHPIVPIMLGDAKGATKMADELLKEGIYVIGFSYPVVPMNAARIRVQISASHTKKQIDSLLKAFKKLGKKYGII